MSYGIEVVDILRRNDDAGEHRRIVCHGGVQEPGIVKQRAASCGKMTGMVVEEDVVGGNVGLGFGGEDGRGGARVALVERLAYG